MHPSNPYIYNPSNPHPPQPKKPAPNFRNSYPIQPPHNNAEYSNYYSASQQNSEAYEQNPQEQTDYDSSAYYYEPELQSHNQYPPHYNTQHVNPQQGFHQHPGQQYYQPNQQQHQYAPQNPYQQHPQQQQSYPQGPQNPFPPGFMIPTDAQQFGQALLSQYASKWIPQLSTVSPEDKGTEFLKVPKYYFAVSNRFVLKKIMLLFFPFSNKTWARKRSTDEGNFEGNAEGFKYLPPGEDVNSPDLYIPVMAFVTYILLVGFIFGTEGKFTPQTMASTGSLGLGVLTLEVLIIRLGLYLINARNVPWLDLIAFRGYKFVGLVVVLLGGLIHRHTYVPLIFYTASMMGLFLMRTYKRIILPHGNTLSPGDVAKRNYFLLGIAVLQYPIYWILAVRP